MRVIVSYHCGMRVAAIRKARHLSQAELADMIGVEQPTISRIERGSDAVTLRVLRQLADALDVTVADLLSEDRTDAEDALVKAFRSLPPERQQGWVDMASAFSRSQ